MRLRDRASRLTRKEKLPNPHRYAVERRNIDSQATAANIKPLGIIEPGKMCVKVSAHEKKKPTCLSRHNPWIGMKHVCSFGEGRFCLLFVLNTRDWSITVRRVAYNNSHTQTNFCQIVTPTLRLIVMAPTLRDHFVWVNETFSGFCTYLDSTFHFFLCKYAASLQVAPTNSYPSDRQVYAW